MRANLLLLLLLAAGVQECRAHGAVAVGYSGTEYKFATSRNQPTEEEGRMEAKRNCWRAGLSNCQVVRTFENTCLGFAIMVDGLSFSDTADTEANAKIKVLSACRGNKGSLCSYFDGVCDATPVAAVTEAAVRESSGGYWDFSGIDRYIQIAFIFNWTAAVVVTALAFWVFVSVLSSAPIPRLKYRAIVAAWIGTPALAAGVYHVWPLLPISLFLVEVGAFCILWTDVFAALAIGTAIRERLRHKEAPPLPSLPFVTFLLSIATLVLAYLYVEYGAPRCILNTTLCWHLLREGFYLASLILLLFVGVGVVLPADSNLVLAYERLSRSVRRVRADWAAGWREGRKRTEEARQAQHEEQSPAAYPVPTIYDPGTVDAMRLKLKRTQRTTMFGKMIFMLDARMEFSREEFELLRKYRLGESLIYESSARERHREAAQAHLEHSEPAPAWGASIGEHAWSMTKGLFRAGRAVTRMTASSLSLKITMNDLIRGKHVECHSLGELMSAETAIIEAAKNLRGYLNEAVKFDGREEIIEF